MDARTLNDRVCRLGSRADPPTTSPARRGHPTQCAPAVRLGPQRKCLIFFDYFVGKRAYFFGKIEPERLGGLEIDDELELGRLLDGKIGRLGPLQDSIDIDGGAPVKIRSVYVIGHQATGLDDLTLIGVHRR